MALRDSTKGVPKGDKAAKAVAQAAAFGAQQHAHRGRPRRRAAAVGGLHRGALALRRRHAEGHDLAARSLRSHPHRAARHLVPRERPPLGQPRRGGQRVHRPAHRQGSRGGPRTRRGLRAHPGFLRRDRHRHRRAASGAKAYIEERIAAGVLRREKELRARAKARRSAIEARRPRPSSDGAGVHSVPIRRTDASPRSRGRDSHRLGV